MASPDTIWHKESLKLKEIFGTTEGFEVCPNQFFHRLIKTQPPPVMHHMQILLPLAVHLEERLTSSQSVS